MNSKRAGWLLALALLPMLTYMGHWQLPVEMLTPEAIFGDAAQHNHATHVHSDSDLHQHTQHCHGEVASCSDIPYAGSAAVVFLAYSVHALALQSPAWLQEPAAAAMPNDHSTLPIIPPPRA